MRMQPETGPVRVNLKVGGCHGSVLEH